MLNAKNRKNEDYGEDGEEHAGVGADGEVEPENLLGAVGEEWEEAEDGGDYGEGDRVDLAGVGFDVEADVGRFGWSVSLFSHRGGPFDRLRDRCTEEGLVCGDEVDAGYVPLPKFYTFKSRDERERILYKNFVQVGEDVKEMIQEIQKHKVK